LNVSLLYFFEGEINRNDFDEAMLQEFNRLPTPAAKRSAIDLIRVFSDSIASHYPVNQLRFTKCSGATYRNSHGNDNR
jgi:hypothetical protein